MASEKKVLLRTSDGKEFTVEAAVAMKSQTIRSMMEEDDGSETLVFPLPNVVGKTMEKVLVYCKKHTDPQVEKEELVKFDQEYMEVDKDELYDLILAANFLNVEDLLELACKKVASMIRDKTPEQIRETFGIENDFTKEEEEEFRKQNPWAVEY